MRYPDKQVSKQHSFKRIEAIEGLFIHDSFNKRRVFEKEDGYKVFKNIRQSNTVELENYEINIC